MIVPVGPIVEYTRAAAGTDMSNIAIFPTAAPGGALRSVEVATGVIVNVCVVGFGLGALKLLSPP